MATQICPSCRADSFTWYIDDDVSPLTQWSCACGYHAFEDESEERICTTCHSKSESKLQDKVKTYWWCFSCTRAKPLET